MAEEVKKTTSTRGRKKIEPKVEINIEKDIQEDELAKAKAENSALAKMLEQMQKQMAQMQAQINSQSNGTSVVIKSNEDITRTVKVVSLVPNVYNLSTQPNGRGRVYTFEKFGDSLNIRFSDMQDILNIYGNQFEKGYAILTNKKDYDDLSIGAIYGTVLTQDQLEDIVLLKNENAVDIILDMDENMQENVTMIIAEKIVDGVQYDFNRIKELEDEGLKIDEVVNMLKISKELDN